MRLNETAKGFEGEAIAEAKLALALVAWRAVDDESEDDDEEVDVDVDADRRELPDEVGPSARDCIVLIGDWGAGLDEEPRLDDGNQLARLRALVRGILNADEPSLDDVAVDGMGGGLDDRLVDGWTRRWVPRTSPDSS